MIDDDFNGYGDVKWDDSIEKIKNIYPNIRDITEDELRKKGILIFETETMKGVMTSKEFYFYNEKLYGVMLNFNNIDFTSENMLLNTFVNKYGKFDSEEQKKWWANDNVFVETTVLQLSLSPKMFIAVQIANYIDKFTKEIVFRQNKYSYFNKMIGDQIEIDYAKKNIEGIVL